MTVAGLILSSALVFTDVAGRPRDAVPDAAPCCITGVVTFVSYTVRNSGVVAAVDDVNGPAIWFAGEINNEVVSVVEEADSVSPGDCVEISGFSSRLGFAPGVTAQRIRRLAKVELPPAPLRRLGEFDFGARDNQRAKMEGVLVNATESGERTHLVCMTLDGEFTANVPSSFVEWAKSVDATLRIEGVATSRFNIRGEFIGVQMEVPSASGVVVVEPPPADPFSEPLSPLDAVMPYSPQGVDLHRRHVRGTVTYAKKGDYIWLQAGESSLKVRTSDTGFARWDEVDAVGFFAMEEGLGLLRAASIRPTGKKVEVVPRAVSYPEFRGYMFTQKGKYCDFNGRFVSFRGNVLSIVADESETFMSVDVEGQGDIVAVRVAGGFSGLSTADVAWRPQVTVTGVMELRHGAMPPDGQLPSIEGWTVRVSSADDVAIVHDGAWKTHESSRNLAVVGWVVLVFAVLVFVALAVNFVQMRIERRRLDILANERKRMAADLHDTLEQHLAGARMMLNSAVAFTPDVPETVRSAVVNANELLAHAKSEMRARIFDMRNDVLFTQGPEKVLKSIAERISAGNLVKVRTRLAGLPQHLAESVFSEMVFIVQEAITNAVKHGHAKTVVLASDSSSRGFTLRIANDGELFDPGSALGPEAGHYGLSGMRERAKRAGIGLSFVRDSRFMVVVLDVPD